MYSVLILTKNEEANIERCLASVSSDDIWVLDSGSTDGTIELCQKHNCNVRFKDFDNYANQRNFGLQFDFKYNWILMLDADEALSEIFKSDIHTLLGSFDEDIGIVSVLRRDYFLGRWLRGASGYPVYFPRIFKKKSVVVERDINEIYTTNLKSIKCEYYLNHYPFSSGVSHWVDKHNRYSSMEAYQATMPINTSDAYWRNRIYFKNIFYKLPFRPLIMFCYLYLFKFGFLAGKPGLYFCLLRAFYELLITIKKSEKNE